MELGIAVIFDEGGFFSLFSFFFLWWFNKETPKGHQLSSSVTDQSFFFSFSFFAWSTNLVDLSKGYLTNESIYFLL